MSFLNLALIVLFFMSFFNGLVLSLNQTESAYKNRFLGVTVMTYSLFLLAYVWWYQEKFILEAPFLMRSISPLLFLSLPFFYFFVRNTLNGNDQLGSSDFLHFIPALICLIDLIPFYTLPVSEKLAIAEKVIQNPIALDSLAHGMIPGNWITLSRFILQFGYYILSIYILFRSDVKKHWGPEFVSIRNWLLVAIALIGFLLFSHFLFVVRNLLDLASFDLPSFLEDMITFLVAFPILLLNIYMQFNQQLVYGVTLKSIMEEKKKRVAKLTGENPFMGESGVQSAFSTLDVQDLRQRLDVLMIDKKAFLNPDLSLRDLAESLDLNQRILSQFIKATHGMGIKEFINQYRIKAAIELMKEGFLETRSLEGLCLSVGFNSRVTFFLAFKKYTGMSPTEYVRHEFL